MIGLRRLSAVLVHTGADLGNGDDEMTRELLMLYGARQAVQQMIKDGNIFFSKQLNDGTCETAEFAEVCDYLFEKIEACKEQNDDAGGI